MIPSGTNRSQVPFFYALTNSNRTSPLADSSARNLSPSRRLQLSIDARSSCSSSLPQQRWYIEAILPRCLSASAKSIEGRRADSNRLPLLITSDNSGVAGVCTSLQSCIGKAVSLLCLALHCTDSLYRAYTAPCILIRAPQIVISSSCPQLPYRRMAISEGGTMQHPAYRVREFAFHALG